MDRRTGPQGWFGIKAHWPQFAPFAADCDMAKVLRIERYIRLKRLDTVAQAVSMVIAKQSGAWISYHDPAGIVSFDFDMIEREYRTLQKQDIAWANYFTRNAITPLTVIYEQLNTNPERVVAKILSFLGLDSPELLIKSGSGPQRQATDRNALWCRQFRQEAASRGVELK
jgi:LPS sulfotransferase NodH